jgi:hypothetical protein
MAILGDEASAEVFLLALDGLFADQPSMEVLEQLTQLLAARFAPRSSKKGVRPCGQSSPGCHSTFATTHGGF